MRKVFAYRLLGNRQVFADADEWLLLCQRLYNAALEQRIQIYRQDKTTFHKYNQMNQLPELKHALPEYRTVDAQVLQDVIERLDRAYEAFFRRVKAGNRKVGFPRFRSRERYDSFTLKHNGWRLDGKYLTISKIGRFKLRLSRPISGEIKTITIHKATTGHWYACFSCDKVPERTLEVSSQSVGLDVGINSFCVDSDGGRTDNPKYFSHAQRILRIRQRRLDRRVKGSHRRQSARKLVAKAYGTVGNQRKHFLHEVANYYICNYGTICIEHLNLTGMVANHHLAKSISDVSWGKFFELLIYKAEEAGRAVIQIGRFEPSSKTCSVCGATNEDLTLSDRRWLCKACGVLHDRDFNAARNILRVGQTLQAQTCGTSQSVACKSPTVGSVNTGNRGSTSRSTRNDIRQRLSDEAHL